MSVQLAAALAEDLVRRGCPADGELLRISKKEVCSALFAKKNGLPCRAPEASGIPAPVAQRTRASTKQSVRAAALTVRAAAFFHRFRHTQTVDI